MLPIYKILSLFLRVFSRPFINITKRYYAKNKLQTSFFRSFYSRLGFWYNSFETKINRKYLKMDGNKNPLKKIS